MMCVLGPSGSGKTSLIHIVSGHIKTTSSQSHVVGGQVVVDGKVLNSSQFQRISGLVTQEDVFNSSLTVGETLNFAAALKLPRGSRRERVDALIASLQLEKCRDTYIGDDANPYLKGVSGGEKRRTAIAMELVDPNIQVTPLSSHLLNFHLSDCQWLPFSFITKKSIVVCLNIRCWSWMSPPQDSMQPPPRTS